MAPIIIKVKLCPIHHPGDHDNWIVDINHGPRCRSLDDVRVYIMYAFARERTGSEDFPPELLDFDPARQRMNLHSRSGGCGSTLSLEVIMLNHICTDLYDPDAREDRLRVIYIHIDDLPGTNRGTPKGAGGEKRSGRSQREQPQRRGGRDEDRSGASQNDNGDDDVPDPTHAAGGGPLPEQTDSEDDEDDEPVSPLKRGEKFPEDNDSRTFVRVGRLPPEDDVHHDPAHDPSDPEYSPRISMNVVVVAVRSKGDKMSYLAVESWNINSRQVGDYASADEYARSRDIPGLVIDPFWRKYERKLSLSQKVVKWMDEGAEPPPVDDPEISGGPLSAPTNAVGSGGPRNGGGSRGPPQKTKSKLSKGSPQQRSHESPIRGPIRPIHNDETPGQFFQTDHNLRNKHAGGISAVICFRNTVADVDLGLATNVQAGLNWRESYASFRRFIKREPFPETTRSSLWQRLRHKTFDWWTDFEIWVLPQRRRDEGQPPPREMLRWRPGVGIREFLDAEGVETYGRQLYIEVRLVEDGYAEDKDKVWVGKTYSYGGERTVAYGFRRTVKASFSLLDDSDDDKTATQQTVPGQAGAGQSTSRTKSKQGGTASKATQQRPPPSGPSRQQAGRKRTRQSDAPQDAASKRPRKGATRQTAVTTTSRQQANIPKRKPQKVLRTKQR
ncbi:Hypothetical predicted protein [Lecanosticta acicola]|uniref:Uncharacterized protein n=1 Tax=Lecanosticta acicola TaxID=111012 RepID=A0AAI9EAT9_9PEZI|nr:Hypothetical predicted protein [Lecanosticta acicola]